MRIQSGQPSTSSLRQGVAKAIHGRRQGCRDYVRAAGFVTRGVVCRYAKTISIRVQTRYGVGGDITYINTSQITVGDSLIVNLVTHYLWFGLSIPSNTNLARKRRDAGSCQRNGKNQQS